MNAAVTISRMSFAHDRNTPLFRDFDLVIESGVTTALMGPSGCGKSSLGRLCVADDEPTAGTIEHAAALQSGLRRGCLYQDAADSVFPWLTASDNLAQPLQLQGRPRAEIAARVGELARRFRLESRLGAWPRTLSGGELQRLAAARTLASPAARGLLVFDEPLSALDYATRLEALDCLAGEFSAQGTTVLYIGHNLHEVLALGRRCIVLGPERPTRILLDLEIDLPFPRDVGSPGYREAEARLLDVLKGGLL